MRIAGGQGSIKFVIVRQINEAPQINSQKMSPANPYANDRGGFFRESYEMRMTG